MKTLQQAHRADRLPARLPQRMAFLGEDPDPKERKCPIDIL